MNIGRFKKVMIMKVMIRHILPEWIMKPIRAIRIRLMRLEEYITICVQPKRHRKALEKVRKKANENKNIKVAFLAIFSSVWKYDGVYQLLVQDARFDPIIIVCPVVNYGKENMLAEMEKAFTVFKNKGYNVIKTYDEAKDSFLDLKKEIVPDIIFYTNPYEGLIDDRYYIKKFKDILTCYVPYAFYSGNINQVWYNSLFQNILWKAFYETEIHKKMAKENARNNGKNVVVTGYPGADGFIPSVRYGNGVWKNTDESLKRIIWAPHHTIDNRENLNYSNFLKYHQYMLDLADKYIDQIQIAFKPHPLLKVKLYNHEEWGKERVDHYYQQWENLKNGQLESDEYVDLFNTSDAMILDSGSFTAEYLYCGKPSQFTFSDLNVRENFNEFGKLALEQHYHAYDESDIICYINRLCDGEDNKKNVRKEFYNEYLRPPNHNSASKNIYEDICKSIFALRK